MMKIVDSQKRWIPTYDLLSKKQENRILFLAEIHRSVPNKGYKIYLCFCDTVSMEFYIEEMVGSELIMIEDDNLAAELEALIDLYGLKTFSALKPWVEQPMVPHPEKRIIVSG